MWFEFVLSTKIAILVRAVKVELALSRQIVFQEGSVFLPEIFPEWMNESNYKILFPPA